MQPDEKLRVAYFENFPDYDRLVITYLAAIAVEADYKADLHEVLASKEATYNAIITEMHSELGVRDNAGLERAQELEVLGLPIIIFTSESVDKASEKNWRSQYKLGENVVFISKNDIQLKEFAQQVKALATQKR